MADPKYFSSQDAMSRDAVKSLFYYIREFSSFREQVVIGLSGGRSLVHVYEIMAQYASLLPGDCWRKLRFCFVDERLVPPYDDQSNYLQLYESLFSPLLTRGFLNSSQILMVPVESDMPAVSYAERVERIDIVLLGVGEDGHIASLFPYHKALSSRTKGYLMIKDSPKPPSQRITVSPAFLSSVLAGFLFFVGEEKEDALNHYLDDEICVEACPAKLIDALGLKEVYVCTKTNKR